MKVSINLAKLNAPGKGILATDEISESTNSRLAEVGIPPTEDSRRLFRQMLFMADGLEDYISGIIINDEALGQKTNSGRSLIDILLEKGVVPGIKSIRGIFRLRQIQSNKQPKEWIAFQSVLRDIDNKDLRSQNGTLFLKLPEIPRAPLS